MGSNKLAPNPGTWRVRCHSADTPLGNLRTIPRESGLGFPNPLVQHVKFRLWQAEEDTILSFSSLNLDASLLQAIQACGFSEPTEIQRQAIPVALAGRDLMASA